MALPRERWAGGGGSATARVVPGQCRSEPYPAATRGAAAPVNKARTSQALVALLVGFAGVSRRVAEGGLLRVD